MATAKIATLVIRTLAKPISGRIKEQARQHERFRGLCVELAQFMYRSEVKLRTNILGEPARHIRPLSEAKAIENGANSLAEGFLFSVAAALIVGEAWRSSRVQSKRRDNVDDQLDELGSKIRELNARVEGVMGRWEEERVEERRRTDELERILERVVEIGLRGGWAEFQETHGPLQLPAVQLGHVRPSESDSSSSSTSPLASEPHTSSMLPSSSVPKLLTLFPRTNLESRHLPASSSHPGPTNTISTSSSPQRLEDLKSSSTPTPSAAAPPVYLRIQFLDRHYEWTGA